MSVVDDLFVFVLENTATGEVRGTCQIFSAVGQKWPFYCYRIGALTQHSEELGRTFRADILNLSTDLEGTTEVGGLFLHPGERSGGLGMLIARSRYLFIRNHRARFADQTLAELRGVIDEAGGSPFWDGVAGRFFGMNFQDADEFNAKHGNQFIADLMPKHPVYIAMLPENARAVIGVPHPSGRAAMRMLEDEGFAWENYVDIFDGGPTMTARTDQIRSVREAEDSRMSAIDDRLGDHKDGEKRLVTVGRSGRFPRGLWLGADRGRRRSRIDPGCAQPAGLSRRAIPSRMWRGGKTMAFVEINFDGIIGPSHNYAGLSLGNLASANNAGAVSQPRAAALQGVEKMRANLRLGLGAGLFHAARPAQHGVAGWACDRYGQRRTAYPRGRIFGIGHVGGQCGDRVACPRYRRWPLPSDRRQSADHGRTAATNGPARCAQLRLAFADAQHFAVHGPVPPPLWRRRRGQSHAAVPVARRGGHWRSLSTAKSGGPFPARQHIEASKADCPRASARSRHAPCLSQQSEAAIAAGAFHNDVVAVANERVLFTHEQAFEDPEAAYAAIRALMPEAEIVDRPRRPRISLADAIQSYLFNAQLVTLPSGEMALILPTEAQEQRECLGLAARDGRGQRPDPQARPRRCAPVDGQWRRSGLPATARGSRSRDG